MKNKILYCSGWFIDKVIFNLFLILCYPFIFMACWPEGYFSLKTRTFVGWGSFHFQACYWKEDGPIHAIFLSILLIGLITFFIFHPIAFLYTVAVILIGTILISFGVLALKSYRSQSKDKQ